LSLGYDDVVPVLTRDTRRCHITQERILHCYRRDNTKYYTVVLYRSLIITFFEATVVNYISMVTDVYDNRDTVVRDSLLRLPWGPSSLRTRSTQSLFTLNMNVICYAETSVLTRPRRRRHIPEDSLPHRSSLLSLFPFSCVASQYFNKE
jgi:hypothetical protein